jgi:hypothetical protein
LLLTLSALLALLALLVALLALALLALLVALLALLALLVALLSLLSLLVLLVALLALLALLVALLALLALLILLVSLLAGRGLVQPPAHRFHAPHELLRVFEGALHGVRRPFARRIEGLLELVAERLEVGFDVELERGRRLRIPLLDRAA